LEALVGRSYGYIHESRRRPRRLAPARWFFRTFPRTFRRHGRAFLLSALVMAAGFIFGGAAVGLDSQAKAVLMPFAHLQGDPSDRVAIEEGQRKDTMADSKARFSSYLMTHNTRVSIFIMVLGITWGIGTIIMLFYNGLILGAVAVDYILAGESVFLAGWLLPHGSIEIPAILMAGQTGLVIAGALIGRGEPLTVRQRFRAVSGDVVTLIAGVALLLVWAGLVEAFLSQYHQPVIPYSLKMAFGLFELALLGLFLGKSGAREAA
ncbi:MAG: stage II sporulation protein M, partial [Desulfosudaceae bacterium]